MFSRIRDPFSPGGISGRHPRTTFQTRAFRKTFYPDVTDKEWNSWHWQARNRIRTLAQLEQVLVLADEEREALSQAKTMLPVSITPYYMSLVSRDDRNQPLRRTVIPTSQEFYKAPGEADDPLGEEADSPDPGPGAPVSGPGFAVGDRFLLELLPVLHPVADGRARAYRPPGGPAGKGLRVHPLDPGHPGRAYLRRRSAGPKRRALGLDPHLAPGDSARGVHSHRHQDACRAAAADHARLVPDAAQTPPPVDEPAFHPPGRMHAGIVPGLHPAGRRGHSPRLADRAA